MKDMNPLEKSTPRPQQANLQVYTIEGNHSTRDRKKALNWTSGNNLPPSFWETRLHVREYLVLNKIIMNGKKKKKMQGSSEITCPKFQKEKVQGKLYSHAKPIIIQEWQLAYFSEKKGCFLLTVVYFCWEEY